MEDDNPTRDPSRIATVIIVGVSLLLITIFLLYIVFTLSLGGKITPVEAHCPVNQCPVSFFSWIKDCSTTAYDPSQQTCNPPGLCTANSTPCAIQNDGSSICTGPNAGVCPPGVECGCTPYQLCAEYIRSYFVPYAFGGTSYFGQHMPYVDVVNAYRFDTPLNAGYPNQKRACLLDESSLSTVANKVCLAGHLTQFNATVPPLYGCANTLGCPAGQHPVWDYTTGEAVCRVVPNWPSFWRE